MILKCLCHNNIKEAVLVKGHVDKDICIGCGLCPDICPEVFRMDEDGKAIAADAKIPDDVIDSAKEAEEQCPVEAIKIE
jgi:ferredoxin